MAETYAQMEEREFLSANPIPAADAVEELTNGADVVLVDVRDTAEMEATGIGSRTVQAPGRAVAWMADKKNEYRSSDLQEPSKRIFTTCGGSPSYRGAAAANVLTAMGFKDVSFVDGGMAALLAAGIQTKAPERTENTFPPGSIRRLESPVKSQ